MKVILNGPKEGNCDNPDPCTGTIIQVAPDQSDKVLMYACDNCGKITHVETDFTEEELDEWIDIQAEEEIMEAAEKALCNGSCQGCKCHG